MSTQHTPGPWRIAPASNYAGSGINIDAGDRGYICLVGGSQTDLQAMADARLIAAAPELLDALQSFLRAPSVGSDGPGSITIVVQEFNLRAARAAISKATGAA